MTLTETIKQHPLPIAIAGFGLYWLYESLNETEQTKANRHQQNRQLRERAAEAFETARSRAGDVASTVQDRASHLADQASHLADQANDAVQRARAKAGEVADQWSDRAGEVAETVQERAERIKNEAGERLGHYSDVVSERRDWAAQELHQTVESNPLAVGIVAAAVGMAFGLMLPKTRIENRTLGSARDHLLEEAQAKVHETVDDLKHKAVDAVKQTAAQAVDTLKEEAQKHGVPLAEVLEGAKQQADKKSENKADGNKTGNGVGTKVQA
jgi:ElaB/YqjD/DUF883 family membrane-anchored ribosome-binding protein